MKLLPLFEKEDEKQKLNQRCSDDGHLVNFFRITAAAEVVDGCVETLQDGAVCGKAAEPLSDLVADIT